MCTVIECLINRRDCDLSLTTNIITLIITTFSGLYLTWSRRVNFLTSVYRYHNFSVGKTGWRYRVYLTKGQYEHRLKRMTKYQCKLT